MRMFRLEPIDIIQRTLRKSNNPVTPASPPPSRRRLAPLKALRVFEAVCRLGSISAAARELSVTHAAVSVQVKLLEEFFGVRLFMRERSGLKPSPQAWRYYQSVHQAFAQIQAATDEFIQSDDEDPLTVCCLPNIAMNWLLPRLFKFNRLHPDIRVNVLTSSRDLDLERDASDVAIWWGESWPGLESVRLLSAQMLPLCSPAFLKAHPLGHPRDLLTVTRLHVQGTLEDWPQWLDHAGVSAQDPLEGMRFDSLAFALRAAAEGVGVAMGRLPLVADDLKAGRLVAPFDIRFQPSKAWHLVYSPIKATARKVRLFEKWAWAESRQFAE